MLIKGNKSKNREELARRADEKPRDPTLPDQIMSFIGEEIARKSSDGSVIDENALDAIMGKRLSKLDIVKQQISQEEIEAQAQKMVEERSEELLAEFEKELNLKRENHEQELLEIKSNAELQANEILRQANDHVLSQAKKLDEQKIQFEKEKEIHFNQIEHLRYDALKDAINEAKPYVSETVELFKNLNLDRRELAQMIKENVATIAFDVAKQILKYEVHVNDNLLEQQVLHSVNKLLDSKGVMRITLNPEDKSKQATLSELLMTVLDTSIRLVFSYDDQVDMGSCTVETQGGKLNSSFSVQLDTIKATFEQYLGHKISILPDEPLIMELNGTDTDDEIDENQNLEETQLVENKSETNLKPSFSDEPSDDELMALEDNFDDFANLDIDDDLDALLGGLLDEDDLVEDSKDQFKTSKIPSSETSLEELSLIDLNDSPEIGANDYANGEDWSAEDSEDFLEDLAETATLDEYQDDEGNKFVEFNEFGEDENFGDSDSSYDERFPEY